MANNIRIVGNILNTTLVSRYSPNDTSLLQSRTLKEDFGDDEGPRTPQEIFAGGTYSEQEFGTVLYKLWEDRWSLTNEQKARIEAITKEPFV